LKERLTRPEALVLPGVYDAYSALLAQRSRFEAVYCGGYAIAASGWGLPDLGLLSLGEIADAYGRVAAAIKIPVIADIDTGYGGTLNVARTIREMARREIRVVQIEDQINPKRCGHLDGKEVVGLHEAATRVTAAVEVANTVGIDVIARTDALAVEGLDAAVRRARLYARCGAAAVLVDGPKDAGDITKIRASVPGPLVHNAVQTGAGPVLTVPEVVSLGYNAVIQPLVGLLSAHEAVREALDALSSGRPPRTTANFAATTGLLDPQRLLTWDARVADLTAGLLSTPDEGSSPPVG
jgi:2-methylisocitrate lyase-like PEP mutase family enzyme